MNSEQLAATALAMQCAIPLYVMFEPMECKQNP